MTVHSMATLRSYRTSNEKRLERILERLRGFYAKNWTAVSLAGIIAYPPQVRGEAMDRIERTTKSMIFSFA